MTLVCKIFNYANVFGYIISNKTVILKDEGLCKLPLFLSFVYVVDSAKTNRQIVSSLYQWDINYRKQIDSLKLENDTNKVKKIKEDIKHYYAQFIENKTENNEV